MLTNTLAAALSTWMDRKMVAPSFVTLMPPSRLPTDCKILSMPTKYVLEGGRRVDVYVVYSSSSQRQVFKVLEASHLPRRHAIARAFVLRWQIARCKRWALRLRAFGDQPALQIAHKTDFVNKFTFTPNSREEGVCASHVCPQAVEQTASLPRPLNDQTHAFAPPA